MTRTTRRRGRCTRQILKASVIEDIAEAATQAWIEIHDASRLTNSSSSCMQPATNIKVPESSTNRIMATLQKLPTIVEDLHCTPSKNLEDVTEMLKKNSWSCFPGDNNSSRVFVRTGIAGRNETHHVVLHVGEDHAKVYVLCDISVPVSKRSIVEDFISRVNRKPLYGSFELDATIGELRYKDSLVGTAVTPEVIRPLLAASLKAMDEHYPGLVASSHGIEASVQENSLLLTV